VLAGRGEPYAQDHFWTSRRFEAPRGEDGRIPGANSHVSGAFAPEMGDYPGLFLLFILSDNKLHMVTPGYTTLLLNIDTNYFT
jgi:hypothetical protein